MALFLANGTRVTLASISKTNDSDPLVVLGTDLYAKRRTGAEDDVPAGSIRTLFAKAGKVVRLSELTNWFLAATVTALTPATGLAAGGTVVTITGTNLDGVSGVTFGGSAGTALTIVSDTELRVTTPAHAAGAVNVVLACDTGNVTVTGGFTYA